MAHACGQASAPVYRLPAHCLSITQAHPSHHPSTNCRARSRLVLALRLLMVLNPVTLANHWAAPVPLPSSGVLHVVGRLFLAARGFTLLACPLGFGLPPTHNAVVHVAATAAAWQHVRAPCTCAGLPASDCFLGLPEAQQTLAGCVCAGGRPAWCFGRDVPAANVVPRLLLADAWQAKASPAAAAVSLHVPPPARPLWQPPRVYHPTAGLPATLCATPPPPPRPPPPLPPGLHSPCICPAASPAVCLQARQRAEPPAHLLPAALGRAAPLAQPLPAAGALAAGRCRVVGGADVGFVPEHARQALKICARDRPEGTVACHDRHRRLRIHRRRPACQPGLVWPPPSRRTSWPCQAALAVGLCSSPGQLTAALRCVALLLAADLLAVRRALRAGLQVGRTGGAGWRSEAPSQQSRPSLHTPAGRCALRRLHPTPARSPPGSLPPPCPLSPRWPAPRNTRQVGDHGAARVCADAAPRRAASGRARVVGRPPVPAHLAAAALLRAGALASGLALPAAVAAPCGVRGGATPATAAPPSGAGRSLSAARGASGASGELPNALERGSAEHYPTRLVLLPALRAVAPCGLLLAAHPVPCPACLPDAACVNPLSKGCVNPLRLSPSETQG